MLKSIFTKACLIASFALPLSLAIEAFADAHLFKCSSLVVAPTKRSFGPATSNPDHLSIIVPFEPIQNLRLQIDAELGSVKPLKHRGEAHITLVTPPELAGIKSILSLKELKELATTAGVLKAEISLECIGRGQTPSGQTYFAVVKSPALTKFRQAMEASIQSKSPGNTTFANSPFHPHITIGFTSKDLHYPDVIKSCAESYWADIQLTN
ncbi:MAG: 2'-5' RNA ligase family protein [Bdellovibrionales bacterium]|nr:2'-5' RNA ligase family protein [Bdellovibrionales bacterium]